MRVPIRKTCVLRIDMNVLTFKFLFTFYSPNKILTHKIHHK